jgi:multidrug efflux pump subunit AcrA (membrane-fusion protein)
MPDGRRRARQRRRRAIAVGVVAATGIAIGLGISVATAQGPFSYRTSVAAVSSVDHTLNVSGTLEPVTEGTAAFQVSGTVAAVDVTKGEKVTAGQTLATMDTTAVKATLTEVEDTLKSAEAKLTEDELDESSSNSSPGDTAQTSSVKAGTAAATTKPVTIAGYVLTVASVPTSATPDGTGGSGSSGSSNGSVNQDQAAVVTDQHQVDGELEMTAADLAAMQSACAGGGRTSAPASTTSTTGPSPSSAGTTVPSPTSTSTTVPSGDTTGSTSACVSALTTASSAEQQVSTDQKILATAETNLAKALTAESKSARTAKATSTPGSTTSSHTAGSSTTPTASTSTTAGTGSTGSSGSTSVDTDTPEQLAGDEATIDADKATLVNDQELLAATTLVSPVSGTVESVDLATGGSVSARSTSDTITVVDWNNYEVAASLTTTQVEGVKIDQKAQVNVDGTSDRLDATVTRVGPVADSDSSYTYPVIVTVTSPTGQLAAGSAAQMVIDLSQADNTVVVPSSAVHTTSTGTYVYVDKAGKEVRQAVKTGLVGTVHTQITLGLTSGQVVILADPSQAVPSSSTNSTTANRFSGTFRPSTSTGGSTTGGVGGAIPPGTGSGA